jgi:hypothetical protein
MHEVNCHAERPLDAASLAASLDEEGIVERMSSTDTTRETCRHERLSVEIAIEWAHLGGD